MKKLYSKPEIMFENFSMSVNLAAGCEVITKLQGENACGYKPDRWTGPTLFNKPENGCVTTPEDTPYNSICYDTPTQDYNLFTSM